MKDCNSCQNYKEVKRINSANSEEDNKILELSTGHIERYIKEDEHNELKKQLEDKKEKEKRFELDLYNLRFKIKEKIEEKMLYKKSHSSVAEEIIQLIIDEMKDE